ncbi:MAG: hypothetical protein CMK07_03310 [Ponticaulis sp.]|nr:hypothetical protein [Ponticaulis sp.]
MRLDTIQALRALAAYLVIFFHIRALELEAATATSQGDSPLIGGFLSNGYAGVDLFFVISGFIMVFVTANRPESLSTIRDFLLARIFRIYPTWWFFAAILATYMVITYGVPWDPAALAESGNGGVNYVIRSIFLLPQPNFPILGVGWTLVHEMYFYFAFAFILLAPRKLLPIGLLVWAAIVTGGALAGWTESFGNTFRDLIFYPMTLEFIAGALAGWLFVKGIRIFPLAAFLIGLVSLFVVMAYLPPPNRFTLIWGRVLAFTLPCVLLVYGAAGLGHLIKGALAKAMTTLGDWSYSLYLSHMLTLAALTRIYPVIAHKAEAKLGLPTELADMLRLGSPGILDNVFFTVTGVIAVTIVAGFSFYLFERPVLKLLNRFRHRQPDKVKARLAETTAP